MKEKRLESGRTYTAGGKDGERVLYLGMDQLDSHVFIAREFPQAEAPFGVSFYRFRNKDYKIEGDILSIPFSCSIISFCSKRNQTDYLRRFKVFPTEIDDREYEMASSMLKKRGF